MIRFKVGSYEKVDPYTTISEDLLNSRNVEKHVSTNWFYWSNTLGPVLKAKIDPCDVTRAPQEPIWRPPVTQTFVKPY